MDTTVDWVMEITSKFWLSPPRSSSLAICWLLRIVFAVPLHYQPTFTAQTLLHPSPEPIWFESEMPSFQKELALFPFSKLRRTGIARIWTRSILIRWNCLWRWIKSWSRRMRRQQPSSITYIYELIIRLPIDYIRYLLYFYSKREHEPTFNYNLDDSEMNRMLSYPVQSLSISFAYVIQLFLLQWKRGELSPKIQYSLIIFSEYWFL